MSRNASRLMAWRVLIFLRSRRPRGWSIACMAQSSRIPSPGAVIGDQLLLRGALVRRHVLQVDPDPVPDRARSAHAVDQDVGRLQPLGRRGVATAPGLQRGHGLVAGLGPRYLDEWHRRDPPAVGALFGAF